MLIDELLIYSFKVNASDLHLSVGIPPMVRVMGELRPVPNLPALTPDDSRAMATSLMTEKQINKLEREKELDFAFAFKNIGRFRINGFFQKGNMGCVVRMVPDKIPSLADLHLPKIVASTADMKRGLVLFTGPTGCGKSSSLAALIDVINKNRACHIMTIEDPIEFVHNHKRAVVNQRELGTDTLEYSKALKHVLRQDPDVILLGEMRDLETIQLAMTAAETGHLVFSTLHTQDTPQTVDRVIDVFPPYQQEQIRLMFANTLRAIFAQQLLKRADGRGRIPAVEVLINNPAISNIIREGKVHQLYSMIQTSYKQGMQTMDASICDLYRRGFITREEAIGHVHSVSEFQQLMSGEVYAEV
ncbi:type IV pilus twitching motility protein PilT [bacterium]|nr:type IV pilus twitching motility protein PilT [bacterium]MBU1025626.1 type IV pilus twitching motility protein PilT [bacterium]